MIKFIHLFFRLFSIFFVLNFGFFQSAQADVYESLNALPVQDGGRIKPIQTLAIETLELFHGKDKYEGRPAVEILFTILLQPSAWEEKPFFEIRHNALKDAMKLDKERKYFSLKEVLNNERLSLVMQDLNSYRETKQKLDPYYQAVQRLEGQMVVFRELAAGRFLRLAPPALDAKNEAWISLSDLDPTLSESFIQITRAFVKNIERVSKSSEDGSSESQVKEELQKSVADFSKKAQQLNPAKYADAEKVNTEVHFNKLHPFGWAALFYLAGFISLLLLLIFMKEKFYPLAWMMAVLGFAFHIYGFGLRIYIMGRAPVTNMYETVVWVALGVMVFAFILEKIYHWRYLLMAGTAASAFFLFLADRAPLVLDPSLQPLEPVLRSNFWLTTHVMTITISYAAFFLAFALSDISLYFHYRGRASDLPKIKALTLGIYRSMQIGIALLAPGIILGGIWADYSWGRFWGWDPKETWAFIVLMGYLAIIHARLVGWVKEFAISVCGVLGFCLVIMAWYGVNFILGAGLHSYGFGAGGVEYVTVFVAAHLLAVIFVALIRQKKLQMK